MNAKTSFFNKNIFFKNIWQAFPLLLTITFTIFIISFSEIHAIFQDSYYISTISGSITKELVRSSIQDNACDTIFQLVLIFNSFCSAFWVFRYLYSQRQSRTLHMLPLTRSSLFVTNICSGFVLIALPLVFSALINGFYILAKGYSFFYVLPWMGITLGFSLFFYSLTVFTVMLTGHIVALPVMYVFLNFGYYFTRAILILAGPLIYGTELSAMENSISVFSPYIYLRSRLSYNWSGACYSNSGTHAVILYSITAIVILAISLFMYRRRPLEAGGDPVVFKKIQPVFHFLGTLLGGSILCIILTTFFINTQGNYLYTTNGRKLGLLILFLVCSILCYYVIKMLLYKTIHVFKTGYIAPGIYLCAAVIIFALLNYDVFGIEKRIPDQSEILSAELDYNSYPLIVDDKESIALLMDLHRQFIDSKQQVMEAADTMNSADYSYAISICYHLKNGGTLSRTYYLAESDEGTVSKTLMPIQKQLQQLYDNSELLLETVDKLSGENSLDNINVYLLNSDDSDMYYAQDSGMVSTGSNTQFLDALRSDIRSGALKLNIYSGITSTQEGLYYTDLQYTVTDPSKYAQNAYWLEFVVTDDCTNLLQLFNSNQKVSDSDNTQ